jgi:hypothetical protein
MGTKPKATPQPVPSSEAVKDEPSKVSDIMNRARQLSEAYCKYGWCTTTANAVEQLCAALLAPDDAPAEPSLAQLSRMAYELRLVPEGETVPVQILDVLRKQFKAVVATLPATPAAVPITDEQIHDLWFSTGSVPKDTFMELVNAFARAVLALATRPQGEKE